MQHDNRRRRRSRHLAAITLAASCLLVTFAVGCKDGGTAGEARAEEADPSSATSPKADPVKEYVQSFADDVQTAFAQRAEAPELEARIQARLETAVAAFEKWRAAPPDAKPERDLWYDGTILSVYEERGFAPLFTSGGHVTPQAKAMFQQLTKADAHGLSPDDYHVDAIRPLLEQSVEISDEMRSYVPTLTERELGALAKRIRAEKIDVTTEKGRKRAADLAFSEGRLAAALKQYAAQRDELAKLAIELEVKLADGYLRYARDMRHGNTNRMRRDEVARYGRPVKPEDREEMVLARLAAQLDLWADVDSPDAVEEHMQSLWPQHEQYRKLLDAYRVYADIVADGGWEEVKPRALRKGRDSSTVAAVKKRFAAEGYWDGPIDNTYSADFIDAMETYQETHQMRVTGESSKVFWRSLNLSAVERFKQIEVNLRRWRRDSHIGYSDYFVYVNVPDFHAEVWRDGKREMRFRIVVGNKDKKCDPETETRYYANATPLQAARMEYLVINPYWNVPPRIEREEYVPKMVEDPQWLEKNGFEYHTQNNYTVLRQLPGEENALGLVKFIFPNPHSTFMHDTPKKGFFRYPVRSFSHGCMRVQDPLDFAEYVLTNDGKWEVAQEHLETGDNRQIDLDRPIDVFVDYTTVRVDDQGRPNFLADIYDYVEDEIDPPSKYSLRCDPEPVETISEARARLAAPEGDPTLAAEGPPAVIEDGTPVPGAKPGSADGGIPRPTLGPGSESKPQAPTDGRPVVDDKAPTGPDSGSEEASGGSGHQGPAGRKATSKKDTARGDDDAPEGADFGP